MKRILPLLILVCLYFFAKGQANYLDSTFHNTGIQTLNHVGAEDIPSVSLTRPNGKSLQVGYAYFDTRLPAKTLTTVTVAQFDLNGVPDPAFGQNGLVVLDQLIDNARALDAVLQPDGKLIVTGEYLNTSSGLLHFVLRLNENGSMDTSFGENGVTSYPNLDLIVRGKSVALQPDGKILMGGNEFTYIPPGSGYFTQMMIRFNANGTVDNDFGEAGVVSIDRSGDILAMAVGPDSIIYAGGLGGSSSLLYRYLPNGVADPYFGTNGVVNLPEHWGIAYVFVQPNGQIIVGGSKKNAGHPGFIRRLNPNGTLDNTFDDPNISNFAQLVGMAIASDGKIIAAEFDYLTLRVFRYLPDGQLDESFDHTIPVTPEYNFNTGVSLQADGKIIIGGTREDEFLFHDFCLLRLTDTLTVDETYGLNGLVVQNFGTNRSVANSIFIDDQNRIVAGGAVTYVDATTIVNLPIAHSVGFISRFQPDGNLDSTFSADGFTALPNNPATLNLMTQLSDGKIMAAGSSNVTFSYSNFAAARLLSDGSLDVFYGPYGNGFTEQVLGNDIYEAYISAAFLAPDNSLVIAGKVLDAEGKYRIAITRFDPSGWPDAWFGLDGVMYSELIPGNFQLNAGVAAPNGNILLGGTYGNPINIFLLRFLPDGTPDITFGNGGVVLKPFGGLAYRVNALGLQPDGKILLCGNQGAATSNNVMVGRLNPDGSKDNSFSTDGWTLVNTGAMETGNALAVLENGKIVVAGLSASSSATNNYNPLIIRLLATGDVDTSFAGTGYIVTNIPGDNQLEALAIQADGNYVTAGYSNNDYLVIRYLNKLSVGLLDEPGAYTEMLVYPNPLQGQATFTYSLSVPSRVTLELFDMQGKNCHSFLMNVQRPEGEHIETLYFPTSLPPGVYTLRVQTEMGSKAVQIVLIP